MSWIGKGRKIDLLMMCDDLGIVATEDNKITELKALILEKKEEHGEEFLRNLLETNIVMRTEADSHKRQLEIDAESHRRQLELAEIEANKTIELAKLKVSEAASINSATSVTSANLKPARELRNLMQKFEPESCDISYYLLMFERQAKKARVEEKDFVSQLMALLPIDVVQIILREPEQKLDDYAHIKQILLKRFKLSPEAFRVKFVQHQRKPGSLFKDFAFELRNYLEEWLKGLDINSFESLKDLMITDVIKRKVDLETKNHFIDEWGKIVSSSILVDKLDDYESVRKVSIKTSNFGKNWEKKSGDFSHSLGAKKGNHGNWAGAGNHYKPGTSKERFTDRNKGFQDGKNNNFEKRKVPLCYECNSKEHLRPACPRLVKRDSSEGLNNLGTENLNLNGLSRYMSNHQINGKQMSVLRDTGSNIDLISINHITPQQFLPETVWIRQPLDLHSTCLPLAQIKIEGEAFGTVITKAAVISRNLDQGYYLLGNRTAELIAEKTPERLNAVITRSQSKQTGDPPLTPNPSAEPTTSLVVQKEALKDSVAPCITEKASFSEDSENENVDLPVVENNCAEISLLQVNSDKMIEEQNSCITLSEIRDRVKSNNTDKKGEYIKQNDLIFRINENRLGNKTKQLLIPEKYREKVKRMAHEYTSAHLGVTKTKDKILRYFYWPNCYKEIEAYVKTCDVCQRVGKPGDKKKAPLKIVPVIKEVFSKINIDACGPLPSSPNGNKYLLTAICLSSKFPDAIPIKDISSISVTDALLNVFSRMGFPKEVQCDQGTSFTSNLTTEFFDKFGIKITHSSVHHPQSNPVERFHRTVKRLLRVMCLENGPDWEKHLPAALLALRTVTHESLGFSPAELVYGKNLRTPETLLYEHWVDPEGEEISVTEYVFKLLNRLKRCQDLAAEKLEHLQEKRKLWYDKNAVKRVFREGDMVLVLATAKPNKLAVNWIGPGEIKSKLSDTNYIVNLPGKKERSQIYHVNMLKPYHKRPEVVNLLIPETANDAGIENELDFPFIGSDPNIYDFEDITRDSNLKEKLSDDQIKQLQLVLNKHANTFSNVPGETDLIVHDIELIGNQTIRAKPYRMSPRRTEILKNEIKKMLDMKVIEIGESDFTSPMILVEAPGKDPRPCIDYRRINEVVRTEYFPLPNIEERVEKVASAQYITILDLAKGYWQIKMSKRAQRLAAFVTSFGTYRPLKMPFGLSNAPYAFSKLMAQILHDCDDFAVPYLDDIAIFSNDWETHLKHLNCVLEKISKAHLTIKPSKCKFAQNHVKYLGHMVGNGFRTPAEAKIQAIHDFPTPNSKTQLRAFLGLAGYYGHYIPNFSIIAAPLTDALKGKIKKGSVEWTDKCTQAFRELKEKLTSSPILFAPVFTNEFIVQVDASDVGMGVVLSQKNDKNEERPVLYLSRKFSSSERSYGTTEKECASIVFAIKKLHYYLDGPKFTVVTDHNPLVWLKTNAGSNPRLMRWSLALQPYNFTIVHRSGKDNKNADCLSRI